MLFNATTFVFFIAQIGSFACKFSIAIEVQQVYAVLYHVEKCPKAGTAGRTKQVGLVK